MEAEEKERTRSLEKKTEVFNKILEVPKEERDRIQRMQVIDRASAAIAAARALIKESPVKAKQADGGGLNLKSGGRSSGGATEAKSGLQGSSSFPHQLRATDAGTPGPDFWSWSPPRNNQNKSINNGPSLQPAKKSSSYRHPSNVVLEKGKFADILPLPFESTLSESDHTPPLPPLQSLGEVEKVQKEASSSDLSIKSDEDDKLGMLFSRHAEEAAEALKSDETSSHGVNPDGSKWWRETGIEQRPDGMVCKWTLIRGVSVDEAVEWEDKFWEASDQFDYKELGSEKSGRDAAGNVWREHWKEAMWQDLSTGLVHMEKTADKWGKNGYGGEWHEKWWEHYDASGQAEKWAHKWCCVDPNTPLEAGHAHVWHERWGEKYDGNGGSMKYTDKWAERSEGNGGWSKWGDKWDEHFDLYEHGVKQGETWWEGQHGEQWNRTWGEQHNGSGWVHKYGKSSSGEHWDTHVQQDTWYERHPHFGFKHCFENSIQLRAVQKPPKAV